MTLSINNTKEENINYMKQIKNEIKSIPFWKRKKIIEMEKGEMVNDKFDIHIPFIGLDIELPIVYNPKYMAYENQFYAYVCNIKNTGIVIFVDDMFMSLPRANQLSIINHEVGHLNKLHLSDYSKVIKYNTDPNYYKMCEKEADDFSASISGAELLIDTLKIIYKHRYLLRFCHANTKTYNANVEFIKERISRLKERHV